MNSNFLQILSNRILVFDGGTGTALHALELVATDFGDTAYAGCNEYLVISKPEAVEAVHREFLEAGCDIIETNTFGATSVALAEYGLEKRARELNCAAAALARRLADAYSTSEKPRFVAGSIGPTTKLPSLGHIHVDALTESYREQIAGLMDGNVDILCIETCQDPLQIQCALVAATDIFRSISRTLPVIVSVTVETMGTMLLGTDIAAVLTTVEAYDCVSVVGLNCATGPEDMEEHLRYLCRNTGKPVLAMPNAGIPERTGGCTSYPLTPDALEQWMERYGQEPGISLIGGCCGTTPKHIARLTDIASRHQPIQRTVEPRSAASSLYLSVALHLEPSPLLIGERCNASGSRQFRDLLLADDYDAMIDIARDQIREGAHIIDVCVAYPGRDEVRDMREVVSRFNTQVSAPLMIDSTNPATIEEALKLYAGKAIVNSINLESGEQKPGEILALCKRYGAAIVALPIDENGMAKTAERKCAIAERIRTWAIQNYGMKEENIIFDPLTFTLGSGDEEFRRSAIETLEAIRCMKQRFPKCHTSIGLSNVSFGLHPRARHVLNSVFLHEAVQAGLDMAIVHPSRIMPLYRIEDEGKNLALDIIYDRRK